MNKTIAAAYKDLLEARELILMPKGDSKAFFEVEIKKVIPVVPSTASEKKAIARSRREFLRGEYVTLDELEHGLARNRAKKHSKTD